MAKLIDLNGLTHVYSIIKGMLAEKLGKNDTAVNAAKVNGLTVETAVPKNAKFTDTVYEHPSTHPAGMITGLADVAKSGSYNDLKDKPAIPAVPTNVSAFINDAGYLTQHQSLVGYVKSVNNTKPDSNGNVTITVSGGGGVSTSESNTWTAQQNFHDLMLNREKYTTHVANGTSDTPITSTMVYAVTGAFTLNLATLAGALSASQSSVFTAYFAANADYSLTISNAGNFKYVGSASDVAITSAGLLLNIWMNKDGGGTLSSIVQASKLS
jgi:hypothetical protein